MHSLEGVSRMNWFLNIKTGAKLALGFGLLLFCLSVMGVISIQRAATMERASDAIVSGIIPVNNTVRDLMLQMVNLETGMRGYLVTGQEKTLSAYNNGQEQLAKDLDYLSNHYPQNSTLKELIEGKAKPEIQGLQATFANLVGMVRSGKIAEARSHISDAKAQFKVFRDTMAEINTETDHLIADARHSSHTAYTQTCTAVLGFTLFALLFGATVAWWIARLVARPLRQIAEVANGLAVGDIKQEIGLQRRDEVGQVAEAFRSLIAYQQEMADIAERMAEGDLAHTITPKSGRDVLGNAFADMLVQLNHLIGKVAHNAEIVAATSAQLSNAAEHTGQAANEIASSIQEVAQAANQSAGTSEEVARGSEQQAHAATEAAAAMTRLDTTLGRVREGSEQQQEAVDQAANGVEQAVVAVAEVTTSTGEMATTVQQTADEIGR